MIGNDVVDLAEPEVRPGARHPRFDQRVFCRAEQQQLARSGAAGRLRWIFWAAKEAAYKVARKLDPTTVFAPRRFEVSVGADLRGVVRHGDHRYPVRVEVEPSLVHAIASDGPLAQRAWTARVSRLGARDTDPGEAVRALAREMLAGRLGAPPEDLEIERVDRIPILLRDQTPLPVDLSLSHHGRYVAVACDATDAPERTA